MRWDDFRRSSNVEDDRGESAGGGFGMPGGAHGLGIGTIIILGLVGWALGIDPSVLINGAQILAGGGSDMQQSGPPPADDARTAETTDFVAAVLGDTEDRWTEIFAGIGPDLSSAAAAAVLRRDRRRLRHGAVGDGAVLLPARSGRLSRHVVLSGHAGQVRRLLGRQGLPILGGLCDRARGRPSRAGRARHPAARDAGAAGGVEQDRGECAAGAHRIAGGLLSPASGRTARRKSTAFSIRATSIRRCRRRPPSATTGCKRRCRAMSCPTASPTALRNSASAGSRMASIPARSRPAIRWRPARCNGAWQDAPAGLSY